MQNAPETLRVRPLLLFVLCFYFTILSRAIFSPLLLTIEESLSISHGAAGSLFLLMSVGYSPVVFSSGFISSRLTHKGTIVSGMIFLSVALFLLSQSQTLGMVRFGSLLLGMGSGLYTASGMASIMHLAPDRHRGKAIAIHELAPNIATLSAPVIAIALLPILKWRQILLVLACITLAVGMLFLWREEGSRFKGKPPNLSALSIYLKNRNFWIITLFFVLNACAALGIYSLLPAYLVDERGMSEVYSNLLVSISRIGSIAIIFLSGWLVDKFGPAKLIAASVILTAVPTVLLGVGGSVILTVSVLIQPMIAVVFFTPALAALSAIGPPESRNVAISITIPAAVMIGGGLFPLILGVLGESGKFYIGFVVLGVLMLACLPLLKALKA